MPSDQQSQEFTASHWRRMAHLAVTYKEPGSEAPLRAFLTRAYITDRDLYSGNIKRLQHTDDQPSGCEKSADSLEPEELTETPVVHTAADSADQQDEMVEKLADLCISADSGAACDCEGETSATKVQEVANAKMKEIRVEFGDAKEPDTQDDTDPEQKLMAQLGLPTNFVVRQRRQNRPLRSEKCSAGQASTNKRNRLGNPETADVDVDECEVEGESESPKRRKSIPHDAKSDILDAGDNVDCGGDAVYAGPHWPDYAWISAEFQRHWAINSDRCVWLAWVRRFGAYMTDEAWSGMPVGLRDDEEFFRLRCDIISSTAAPLDAEAAGLPIHDWELEWQRNEETAFWAEMLRFCAHYRPGRGAKQAALKLAKRLGFAYTICSDLREVVSSHYDMLPSGETVSRLPHRSSRAMHRNDEHEAIDAETALYGIDPDPAMNKYFNQRYRFFDRYDKGIMLDREAWFSVTPQRIARHQAERLKCPTGLLVDAFCGAGGNAIQFAQLGGHVVAVDIDASRLAMAEHNAGVYDVRDRISFLCADYFDALPRLAALSDALFLSPPWGGPSYLDRDVFDLDAPVLSRGRSIADCVRVALGHCDNIAMYLPRNVDLGQLARLLCCCRAGIVEVEQNLLNGRLKALTVYTGNLVDAVTPDY